MVLNAIISISLDISTNISWWIIKKTLYGTYYITTYFLYSPPPPTKEEIELLELRREIGHLNRKLYFLNSIENNPDIIDKNKIELSKEEADFVFIDDTEL
jgi:hypothetical protein